MKTNLQPLLKALQEAKKLAGLTEQSVNAEYEALPHYTDCKTPEEHELRRETREAWLHLYDLEADLQTAVMTLSSFVSHDSTTLKS